MFRSQPFNTSILYILQISTCINISYTVYEMQLFGVQIIPKFSTSSVEEVLNGEHTQIQEKNAPIPSHLERKSVFLMTSTIYF